MPSIKPIILAYYLPQFHPLAINDLWWGKGFTEWDNVKKAKPLFKGHKQPRVPADLGYYDLTSRDIRRKQAELAKEAGISGFCYWHYWFGNKNQIMNEIIDEVVKSKEPDFPFCLGWANESWTNKQWQKNGNSKSVVEQKYGGEADYKEHFAYALKLFKDSRYIKINNKPVFLIYRPELLPDDFCPTWERLAKEFGFDGIYFIGRLKRNVRAKSIETKGIQIFTRDRINSPYMDNGLFHFAKHRIHSWLMGLTGTAISYKDATKSFVNEKEDSQENFIPTIIPNWDHSPRTGKSGFIIYGSTPDLFFYHAKEVLEIASKKENNLVFLKSWNEWGEGNYMEPDAEFGTQYIKKLAEAIKAI